jgi:hypothetical protein
MLDLMRAVLEELTDLRTTAARIEDSLSRELPARAVALALADLAQVVECLAEVAERLEALTTPEPAPPW